MNIDKLYLKEKIIAALNKVKFHNTDIKYLIFDEATKNYSHIIEMLLLEK